jgi:hypothetical protein
MGDPPRPHVGFHSNLAVFMLVPWIVSATLVDRRLSLTGHRLYRPEGDCLLLLGDRVVPASDYIESTEASVSFDLPGDLPAGAYGVRVRVDGVENIELPRVEVLGP